MSSQDRISEEKAASLLEASGGEALEACRTCDKCVESCFLETFPERNPRDIPLAVLEGMTADLVESEYLWGCTLCGQCVVDCPKDIRVDRIVRKLRGVALERGNVPKRLMDGLSTIKEKGNSVGIDEEEFVETLQWLGEEAAAEIEGLDEDYQVPVDKEGAEFLFIPNPREYTSSPTLFTVYLKFFASVNADFTYASNLRDISNWAYFMGDDETTLALVRTTVDTARKLGVKAIVTTECGHGFKILRKDAAGMIGEPLGFEVISIVELALRYFKEGRLKIGQAVIPERVTYHDPCNVGRQAGVYEDPRELLRHIAKEYVEMEPYGKYGICCGAGGSVAQNTDMGQKRLQNARAKAEQIKATGATVVTTSCQACLAQLSDIQAHYHLPVTTRSVMELVMEALSRHHRFPNAP